MPDNLKKVLSFALPTMLAAFIIVDTFVPFFSRKNESLAKAPTKARSVASVAPVPARLQIPDGHYYTFKANYACDDPQTNLKISSHFDSYQVQSGRICRTGDACSTLNESSCQRQAPVGLQLARNRESFTFDKKIFRRLAHPVPPECPIQSCGVLPESCRYEHLPPLNDNGCPQGCGTIVCRPQVEQCAPIKCAAPPQNCHYSSEPPRDAVSGCIIGCGDLTCDSISTRVLRCTDELKCEKLPENCNYVGATHNSEGCKKSCGQVECKRVVESAATCAAPPVCTKLPPGCYYAGEAEKDEKGCVVGCRSIVCEKHIPAQCRPPVCAPAPLNCRYDGNSPQDFEGCSTDCGQLICSSN